MSISFIFIYNIKYNFITPALVKSGWQDKITMETAVKWTDGKINLKGNIVNRDKPKKADYILYINKNNPIAIVEAKDNNHIFHMDYHKQWNMQKNLIYHLHILQMAMNFVNMIF